MRKEPQRRRDQRPENKRPGKYKRCRLCHERKTELDYKDVATLQRFSTIDGKITSRKRSGLCAHHQRSIQRAIKQAHVMALIPVVG